MPGFSINNGGGISNTSEFKRKHRWNLELGTSKVKSTIFLKSANRPELTIDVMELHYNQEKVFHNGKHSWNDIQLVWYDAEQPNVSRDIYAWINEVVKIYSASASRLVNFKKDAKLYLTDGSGKAIETWKLYNAWPYKVNWGDLTYETTGVTEISVALKYDKAELVIDISADIDAVQKKIKELLDKAKGPF